MANDKTYNVFEKFIEDVKKCLLVDASKTLCINIKTSIRYIYG